jgi:gentisate 1,2-dioxygenase
MTLSADAPLRSSEELHRDWAAAHVRPLWEVQAAHKPPPPGGGAHIWRWRELEPLIFETLKVTTPEVAERRVLSFIDPTATGDQFHTVSNLNAALQILSPGETARPHRHSMNALRFVLRGSGAITIVDGKPTPMAEGDLLLTPGWCWHSHDHQGSAPIVWMDVLDVALHMYLGTDAFEPGPVHDIPPQLDERAFGSPNVVPDLAPSHAYSPTFRYPLADAVAALAHTPHGRDGARRVRYVNPQTGGPVMLSLDCALVELDAGVETVPFTTSANAVCAVVSGSGTTTVGGKTFDWEPGDVFTLPHKQTQVHKGTAGPARVFVVSDREVYRRLDLLTETFG